MHPVSHPAFAVATALHPSVAAATIGKWIFRRASDAQSARPIQTDPPDAALIEWLSSYSAIVNYNTISQASLFLKFFLTPLFPSRFGIWARLRAVSEKIDKLPETLPLVSRSAVGALSYARQL
jgi:hypothetical protein